MMEAFTPAQEKRLREIIDARVDLAVAVGAGDTPRLMMRLDFLRLAAPTHGQIERADLVDLALAAADDANFACGIRSDLRGDAARGQP